MNQMTDVFEAERKALVSLCYRMLGETAAAEDAVQETWLRWAAANSGEIENPAAWLRRVATNIAIDTLRKVKARREHYVGPWLPEPILHSEEAPAPPHFELAQECELALLWAMERLTARERAAFILREAFDATYGDIADALKTTEATCRQLVSRSQKKLQEAGPRFDTPPEEIADLTARFFAAAQAEDPTAALRLMTASTLAISDGGAHRRAARRPLVGGAEIMQVFGAIEQKRRAESGWQMRLVHANRRPAVAHYHNGTLDALMTLAPDGLGQIGWLYIMVNPDKLAQASLLPSLANA